MPDYTACRNHSCSRRMRCARYRMRYSDRQSMSSFPSQDCTYYIDLDVAPFGILSDAETACRATQDAREDTGRTA